MSSDDYCLKCKTTLRVFTLGNDHEDKVYHCFQCKNTWGSWWTINKQIDRAFTRLFGEECE